MSEVQIPASSPLVSYTGDSVQNVFAFPYYFAADTDLRVYVGGALATLGVDYVATGMGVEAGGAIDFTGLMGPPSVAASVVLARQTVAERLSDFTTAGGLSAPAINQQLDAFVVMLQDMALLVDRLPQFALAESLAGLALKLPKPVPGYYWKWKDDGSGIEFAPSAGLPTPGGGTAGWVLTVASDLSMAWIPLPAATGPGTFLNVAHGTLTANGGLVSPAVALPVGARVTQVDMDVTQAFAGPGTLRLRAGFSVFGDTQLVELFGSSIPVGHYTIRPGDSEAGPDLGVSLTGQRTLKVITGHDQPATAGAADVTIYYTQL